MRNGEYLKLMENVKHEPYIVEGLVGRNRLAMAASPPGEGKSIVFEGLLYHVVYEAPFLGKKVSLGNIMLIDSENRHDIHVSRFMKIKNGLAMDGYKMKGELDVQSYSGFLLDDPTTWPPMEREIKDLQPSLIMFDHLACFHHRNEDKANPMERVAEEIEKIMDISKSSALVMHHFGKDSTGSFFKRLRGSSAIYAKTDFACEVRTLSIREGRLEKVGIIPQPRKDITPPPFRIKIEEGDDWLKFVYDGFYRPMEDPLIDLLAHRIYHTFLQDRDEKDVYQTQSLLGGLGSETQIRTALHDMEKTELLVAQRKGRGGKWHYELPPAVVDCPWCSKV